MIRVKNINKIYKDEVILDNINLDIDDGSLVMIYGKSGSGKSTFLNILSSLIKPTSGLIEVNGENIVSLNDMFLSDYRAKKVGYVTQTPYLIDNLTIYENLLAPLILEKISFSDINSKIDNVLGLVDMLDKKEKIVNFLSGGEKQRVVIARALINNPNIIICDEPTSALDKENSLEFLKLIERLHNEKKTIIIATHDDIFYNLKNITKTIYIDGGKIG